MILNVKDTTHKPRMTTKMQRADDHTNAEDNNKDVMEIIKDFDDDKTDTLDDKNANINAKK